jgi:hypothetical protein
MFNYKDANTNWVTHILYIGVDTYRKNEINRINLFEPGYKSCYLVELN